MRILSILSLLSSLLINSSDAQQMRARDHGIKIGVMQPAAHNAITDVAGVSVGHFTHIQNENVRTGITAILPHTGNIYQQKVPAAIYIGNGYGKLMGYSQVEELGNIETPILLTNTLSVPTVANGLITHILGRPGNENVRSVNAIVGETNDGHLNDIRGRHLLASHVQTAIENASNGPVTEGNVGAGTGTICFGFKGGIGTSSRKLPSDLGGYTVGVLVQSNFGGVLEINGAPIGKELNQYPFQKSIQQQADGSCMMVIATDAPLSARNLKRLAKRAMMGLAKTGGIASNGSGDYVIAFSTQNLVAHTSEYATIKTEEVRNEKMTPLFLATIEATEEAIINALFAAEDMVGKDGHEIKAIPTDKIIELLKKHSKIN